MSKRKRVTIVSMCDEAELGKVIDAMDSDHYTVKWIIQGKNKLIIVGELSNFLEEYRSINERLISFLRFYADMYMAKDRNPVLSDQVKVYRAALTVMKECGMSVFNYTDFLDMMEKEGIDPNDKVLIEKFCK